MALLLKPWATQKPFDAFVRPELMICDLISSSEHTPVIRKPRRQRWEDILPRDQPCLYIKLQAARVDTR